MGTYTHTHTTRGREGDTGEDRRGGAEEEGAGPFSGDMPRTAALPVDVAIRPDLSVVVVCEEGEEGVDYVDADGAVVWG